MKDIITFIAIMVIYYLLIAFIISNPYLLTWHWGVKLTYVLLGLYTVDRLNKNSNI